ncbi:AAA family ATPase [Lampropedia puyangensis]|uniref:AAA family ATPase n=1 Tax=Lampropedia puyangensis TaxID=1330072 RepID=A0A4S8ESD7_9BURK|nr:AAA family ATPase [Lampropedia puyangensis]THT96414.1 AAA family ATPase [Lampropedia puyangensis]
MNHAVICPPLVTADREAPIPMEIASSTITTQPSASTLNASCAVNLASALAPSSQPVATTMAKSTGPTASPSALSTDFTPPPLNTTLPLPCSDTSNTTAHPLRQRMVERQQVLDTASATLKTELFGLETVIDRVIDSIRAWYLLPELIERPVIICLWGLTGTGKTQLARRLVQQLKLDECFVEVQMDGFSHGSQGSASRNTIASMLDDSGMVEGQPGVLLLDEFQRFRTIDRKGEDVAVKRYQDVWTLLSDGRLSPALGTLERLEMELAHHQYKHNHRIVEANNDWLDMDEEERTKEQAKRNQRQQSPFKISPWDAQDIRQLLKLSESVTDIMRWEPQYACQRLAEFRASPQAWGSDRSKLLILVTGNLDEMYQGVARRVQDCDTDADVFHRFTEKLSSIDVKQALAKRFRPEQVARLGNQHVVFPSLKRAAYECLIAHACEQRLMGLHQHLGLKAQLSQALLAAIYDNAVFPVQGTRPVFSTVHAVLGPALSQAAVWVLAQAEQLAQPLQDLRLLLDMSADGKHVALHLWPAAPQANAISNAAPDTGLARQEARPETKAGAKGPTSTAVALAYHQLPLHLELDQLRKRTQADFRTLLAVHEAGHGLVYALLNQCAPTEVRINVASFEGGYASYTPRAAESRRMARDEICTTLAGRAAEVWVFGQDAVSTGAEEDLTQATKQAARYHRHWGMGDRLSHVDITHDTNEHLNTDIAPSNAAMEASLQAEMQRAHRLLQDAREPFERLVQALIADGHVQAKDFAQVTGLNLPAPSDALEPWEQAWRQFLAA